MLNSQIIELFRGKALTAGALTRFASELPMGEAWTRMMLRIKIVLANTTGTTAINEGSLQLIKGVSLRTDKGELLVNSAPGRLLYAIARTRSGVPPTMTTWSVTAGTFYVHLEIPFSDMRMASGQEQHRTILDTKRYKSMELSVNIGTVADLMTSVGDSAITVTLDAYVERLKGNLPPQLAPSHHVYFGVMPPVIPTTQAFIDLEKTDGLDYKRLHVFSTTGSTSGVPISGTASDACLDDYDIEHNDGFEDRAVLADEAQRAAQTEYGLASIPSGHLVRSFVDRSKEHATVLKSGGRSMLKVGWRNGTSPATPQVTVGFEAIKPLA